MISPTHASGESTMKVYFDFRDWWIGLYIGPNHLYFCILTLVLRVKRRG